jgi:hypothetical protein
MTDRSFTETFKVAGSQLVDAVKQLLHEGNVRRVIIKQGDHTVVEFPLTVGVVGAVLAPILAVLGALATVMTESTVVVERTRDAGQPSASVTTDGKRDAGAA